MPRAAISPSFLPSAPQPCLFLLKPPPAETAPFVLHPRAPCAVPGDASSIRHEQEGPHDAGGLRDINADQHLHRGLAFTALRAQFANLQSCMAGPQ